MFQNYTNRNFDISRECHKCRSTLYFIAIKAGFERKLAMNSFLCRLSPAGIEIFLEIQLVSRIVSALISTSGSSRATILGFLYLSYCILVDLMHFKISEVLIFLLFAKFYRR